MKKYYGDWYGKNVEWVPYYHVKTDQDPHWWPDKEWRIKPVTDIRENGGFSLAWALHEDQDLLIIIEEA